MAVTRQRVEKIHQLIGEVRVLSQIVLEEMNNAQSWDIQKRAYVPSKVNYLPQSKNAAALKRRSMDLTRELAKLRNPQEY